MVIILKPCPFCGATNPQFESWPLYKDNGEPIVDSQHNKQVFSVTLSCQNLFSCGAAINQCLNDEKAAKDNIAKSWNKRVKD